MSFRLAAKPDANQAQIVKELRHLGFDVDIVHREKKLYDLLVSGVPSWSVNSVGLRVEVKADAKKKLTNDEFEYWQKQNNSGNLIIATCTEDILEWFGLKG